jgi:hypothetical protein
MSKMMLQPMKANCQKKMSQSSLFFKNKYIINGSAQDETILSCDVENK